MSGYELHVERCNAGEPYVTGVVIRDEKSAAEMPLWLQRHLKQSSYVDGVFRFAQPFPAVSVQLEKEAAAEDTEDDGVDQLAEALFSKLSAHIDAASKITIDPDVLSAVQQAVELVEERDMTKLATCEFVNKYCDAIEADKVDSRCVGMTVPVKVAFNDTATRDFFLGLFNGEHQKQASMTNKLAELFVERGIVAHEKEAKRKKKKKKRKSDCK